MCFTAVDTLNKINVVNNNNTENNNENKIIRHHISLEAEGSSQIIVLLAEKPVLYPVLDVIRF